MMDVELDYNLNIMSLSKNEIKNYLGQYLDSNNFSVYGILSNRAMAVNVIFVSSYEANAGKFYIQKNIFFPNTLELVTTIQ